MDEIFCIREIFVDRGGDLGSINPTMARESVIIECTEAERKASHHPATWRPEIKASDRTGRKENTIVFFRHTLHKEIKN